MHENYHSLFPGENKKNVRDSDMLIGTSCRESVRSLLVFVVVLCGYQIYQFPTCLRFILSLNSVHKGIKLYLHEVPDIPHGLQCWTYTDVLKSYINENETVTKNKETTKMIKKKGTTHFKWNGRTNFHG